MGQGTVYQRYKRRARAVWLARRQPSIGLEHRDRIQRDRVQGVVHGQCKVRHSEVSVGRDQVRGRVWVRHGRAPVGKGRVRGALELIL